MTEQSHYPYFVIITTIAPGWIQSKFVTLLEKIPKTKQDEKVFNV